MGLAAAVIVLGMTMGITLSGCKKTNRVVAEPPTTNIENPLPVNPINPVIPTDPTMPTDPTEQYTEAEYKVICEEKIENLLVSYFAENNVNLSNVQVLTINKLNGNIYYTASLNNKADNFCTANLNIENVENYKNLHNQIKNKNEITLIGAPKEIILNQVDSDIYSNFLNSVVEDEGFRIALENEDINISENINQWQDLATIVNARIINNKVIEIDFVDLMNNKTVEVRVRAELTLQESSSAASQVFNTTNKDKTYTLNSVQDYSTFPEVEAEYTPDFEM